MYYYGGPFYIIYSDGPGSFCLRSSFLPSYVEGIKLKLMQKKKMTSVVGEVSQQEEIPIERILTEITFPEQPIAINEMISLDLLAPSWIDRLSEIVDI